MAAALAGRGPDDQGFLARPAAGLAHRRLSIIDLEGGHQPILSEDGSLALVGNGEIYDFRELRTQLEARGHRFRTGSDNEVVLHLYEEYGTDCLARLNGMFAFAILELESGRLFLARDRFGQKPLFYTQSGGRFAFASGPAALQALPWVSDELDLTAVHDFLEYQYIPEPRSIYQDIRKFPPHHFGIWEDGRLRLESYWEPRLNPTFSGTYKEAQQALQAALEGAVARRLVADVPVGIFLSGGFDSTLICALAQAASATPVQTFSIGFPEKKYDEREFAAAAARHLGTNHHFREVQPDDFERLTRIVADFEEPFGDASMLPTWLLSQFARQEVKVALSGDGADELFGGYYRYRIMHLCRCFTLCPAPLRRRLRQALLNLLPPKTEERTFWGRIRRLVEISDSDGLRQYLTLISRCPEQLRRRLYGERMRDVCRDRPDTWPLEQAWHEHPRLVDAIMELDISTYLNNDILVKVDRASMAHALEVRNPFLDRHVAKLALSFPYEWKQRGSTRKRILLDTFGNRLPRSAVKRPKMGFGVPLARWFRAQWRQPAEDLLIAGKCVESGLFSGAGLQTLLEEHNQSRADHSYTLFNLLVLEIWLRKS